MPLAVLSPPSLPHSYGRETKPFYAVKRVWYAREVYENIFEVESNIKLVPGNLGLHRNVSTFAGGILFGFL